MSNWHQHLNWLHVVILVGVPLLGLYGWFTTQLQTKTLVWAVIYYFMTGLGITAGVSLPFFPSNLTNWCLGYHRLWAHRSYTASRPLQYIFAALGGGAVEGSIRWWSRDHRAHHRYTDTEKDPYSVRKGLMYAHLGWMLLKQNPKRIGRTDITDLNSDKLVRMQHKYYGLVVLIMGFLVPAGIAGVCWGDWRGGFYYAGMCRLIFVHHATFCVNSLAHWLGDQPFDDRHSPRDHIFTAFVTLGEGYHNYHHSYPSDYRNAIQWWQYDPTKWLIQVCFYLGLASGLKEFSNNEIQKGMLQQQQKKLDQWRAKLDWGIPLDRLPVMEFEEFEEQAKSRPLILVAGVVHDVGAFIKEHPGGVAMISSGIGKDMTGAFNGGKLSILSDMC
jgi:stearoyl-CoA desaturase (Delta-9 desaturase)